MNAWMNDFRYAARQLRKSPGFTITAILTLALGVGACAAVWSVIDEVLLAPLPYPEPERLVGVAFTFPMEKTNAEQAGTTADFVREHATVFSASAVLDDSSPTVNLSLDPGAGGTAGRARQVNTLHVSEGYFRTLGVSPMIGRGFSPDEDRPGGGKVVILSYGLWKRLFHGEAGVIGRTVRINEESYTAVGVMPEGFAVSANTAPGVAGTPEIWQPLQLSSKDPGYDGDNYEMIARVKPGVTLAQAQQQLRSLAEPFYQSYPEFKKWATPSGVLHEFRLAPLRDVMVSQVRRSLWTVMGAVGAVLLVACLNLAGLMLAQGMRRSREMAMRSALGATAGQLLRLLVCEGILLAAGGGAMAMGVASLSTKVLLELSPLAVPLLRADHGALAQFGRLALPVMGIVTMASMLFCLLPALSVLRLGGGAVRMGGQGVGESRSQARLSRLLLIGQVALAMMLVSTASLLLGTFVKLRGTPSGIEPKRLTVFQVALKGERYASVRQTTQFVSSVLEQLRHTPGVASAAAINGLPLDRGLNIGGYPAGRKELRQTIEFRAITPEYLKTMGVRLISGRDINDGDIAGREPVALVDETTARKWWPGRSPLGEELRSGTDTGWRIVGVVSDVQQQSLLDSGDIVVYGSMAQVTDFFEGMINNWFPTTFAIRTAADVSLAGVAQQAVERADPEIPIARLTSMQSVIDRSIQAPRFFSLLASGFSLFSVGLMVIGIFGLMSYQVTQRAREIGVRMALGADRAAILTAYLGRGLKVTLIGLAAGLVANWLTRPVITHLLSDAGVPAELSTAGAHVLPQLWVASAASMAAILVAAMVASWLPARRAASTDPMIALRAE